MADSLVLDASAILAEIKNEPGVEKAGEIRAKAKGRIRLHAINACEIAYVLMRNGVPEAAALDLASPDGVEIVEIMDQRLWQRTAVLKARHKSLSMADCVVVALAEHFEAGILTGDRGFGEVDTTAERVFFR